MTIKIYSNGCKEYYKPISELILHIHKYADCENHGHKTDKICMGCESRWYSANNLEVRIRNERKEIKKGIKQINKEVRELERFTRKELKTKYPQYNNKKKASRLAINRMLDNEIAFSSIAKEYRLLIRKNWLLYEIEKSKLPKLVETVTNNIPDYSLWNTIETLYAGTYNSQGWGERKYSLGVLQWKVFLISELGIKINTVIIYDGANYKLLADIDIDKELVNEKISGIEKLYNLSYWTQWHWNRNRNPRVYNPFLPYEPEYQPGYDKSI